MAFVDYVSMISSSTAFFFMVLIGSILSNKQLHAAAFRSSNSINGESRAIKMRSSSLKKCGSGDIATLETQYDQQLDELLICAIASDIDGTLLNSSKTVSKRNADAVRKARAKGILFFPATGKSRQGVYNALGDLGEELKADGCPGVYLQGLIVYGHGQDNVIFERLLPQSPVDKVVQFCTENNVSLLAYHGDRILCNKRDQNIDKLIDYCEPTPEEIGPLNVAMKENGQVYHKMILMGNDADQITSIRPAVEKLVGSEAVITQALGDMLEVLPPGGSKGDGVSQLLNHLNIVPSSLLALGDAENDIEMLKLAGIGVVMGNANEDIFQITKYRTSSNDCDGVAEAIELYCIL
mmetsp:Transcript_29076/g.38232  ORF Transcript_29076/g.38232 Transcript_29076/m.38232 type:complete len:352 (-) Transcript_29076:225-1280(-)